jgi:hypothetical protein
MELSTDSETFQLLSQMQGKAQAKKTIKQMPMYWGDVIFTAGPVYVGAIICLLFVLGLFILDKKVKWWLLITTIVSLIFAWGKHIPGITNFLFEYLPGYNKFRAVSSALVIAQFTMPLMAILTLTKIFNGIKDVNKLKKSLYYSFGITAGLALIFALFGKGMFGFEALSDEHYIKQGATQIVDAWQTDRAMLLRKDAFRSFLFISLAAGLLYFYIIKKLKFQYAIAALGLLILVDMWPVNKRFFNNEDFVSKREDRVPFAETPADKYILSDNDPHYRVLNLSVSPFQDASTSYFHKSIGGYHGAKWRRYQELYEHNMFHESQGIIAALQSQDPQKIELAFKKANALNMFNTKYIIYNPKAQPLRNLTAYGHAWFVNDYRMVENADEEIASLREIEADKTALVDKRFADIVENKVIQKDSLAVIQLDEYKPNYLKYSYSSTSEQLALFPEVYYPKGWIATIDGEEVQQFRANYILRAMFVPAGEHTIEFSFEPQSYALGGKISAASSWILFISILGAVLLPLWKERQKDKAE